jgi:hypothetical protein
MKTALCIIGMGLLFSCGLSREIEVNIVSAELVRIDTIYRYPNLQQQVLTWRSRESNVQYVSYASIRNNYALGSRMLVMVRK